MKHSSADRDTPAMMAPRPKLTQAKRSFPRKSLRSAVILGSLLIVFALGINAQTSREPSYQRTVSVQEAFDYLTGGELDKADPTYCEKARDMCLVTLCATTERKNARPRCWAHCTELIYAKCMNGEDLR